MSKITKEQELQEARNLLSDHDSVINKEDYDYIDKVLYKCMNTIFPEQPHNAQVEEVYLITQEGKYLRTYNEFGYIEETDDNNEAHMFSEPDSDVDLYCEQGQWIWKDEPLLALNEDDFATYMTIQGYNEHRKTIKSHTPSTPTEEDVCKALSEYFNEEVVYYHNRFYINHTMISKTSNTTNERLSNIDLFDLRKAPHLITMIEQFYESVVSK